MARLVPAFEQFFDSSGDPLISGKLFFFESGSSSVFKTTFANVDENIANSNPVILNGDGRAPNIFGSGSYRVVLTNSDEVQIIVRDPVGGTSGQTFGADWNSVSFYSIGDVVRDDGSYWISITSSNQGNQPSIDVGINWRSWPDGQDLSNASVTASKIKGSITGFYTDSGIADAYVLTRVTTTPPIDQYDDGAEYSFVALNPNMGASTANIDGLGIKNIKLPDGTDPAAGNITSRTNVIYDLANDRLELQTISDAKSGRKNLLYGLGRINQEVVTGSVVLAAGEYGHDGFRGGAAGATYTFSVSGNVTTFDISAGSLEQEVLGSDIFPSANAHILSWVGTAQAQIDAGGFAVSPVSKNLTGGTNAVVEWGTGTLSLMQLEKGTLATEIEWRSKSDEIALSERFFRKSYLLGVAPGTVTLLGAAAGDGAGGSTNVSIFLGSRMEGVLAITIYNPDSGATGTWRELGSTPADRTTTVSNIGDSGFVAVVASADDVQTVTGHWTADTRL